MFEMGYYAYVCSLSLRDLEGYLKKCSSDNHLKVITSRKDDFTKFTLINHFNQVEPPDRVTGLPEANWGAFGWQ